MLSNSYAIDEEMIHSLVDAIRNLFKTVKQVAQPVILDSVFQTNIACIKLYDLTKRCRKELPTLDYYLSQIETGCVFSSLHIRHFIRYFVYNAVELNYYPWISVSSYSRRVQSYINEPQNNIPTISNTYLKPEEASFPEAFSRVYRSIDASTVSCQTLITMATGFGSARIIALWNPDRADFVPTMEKSNIDFILVEYGHPKMKGLLQIQLPDSVYMVGNEILSKSFVLRHLDHSCIPNTWYFDEDYIVRIIDHNADSLEIRSHQYIVLEKDGYKVMEDDYADLPDLISVDSIDNFMCENDSENESPAGYMAEPDLDDIDQEDERPAGYISEPDSEPVKKITLSKRTYSIDDAVFVLDDFMEEIYGSKIDLIGAKPKQD
jgi:hypothetical protein